MIVVITNKAAGTGEGGRVAAITEAFIGSGATPHILEADGADLTDTARKAIASGARVVVAAGGDGTVNAIATAVIESGAVLGVLPMGTLNHFAKDAGIPLELPDAARAIVEENRPTSMSAPSTSGSSSTTHRSACTRSWCEIAIASARAWPDRNGGPWSGHRSPCSTASPR